METAVRPKVSGESKRTLILDSASEAFAYYGYNGASMQHIAERVGIQKASLFYHFPSKEALYAQVSNRFVTALHDAVLPALSKDGPRSETIEVVAGHLFDLFARNPNCARMFYRELLDGENRIAEVSQRWFGPLFTAAIEFYEDGRVAGEFKLMDPMHFIVSTLGAITFYFVAGPVFEPHFRGELMSPELLAERRREVIRHTLQAIVSGC